MHSCKPIGLICLCNNENVISLFLYIHWIIRTRHISMFGAFFVYISRDWRKDTMIRMVEQKDIRECVKVIRRSFSTVADEFGFTMENAPRFTAFATTEDRINWHLNGEHRPMYVYCEGDMIVGYYSLLLQDNNKCELNNVCVLPEYRHKRIGEALLKHAFETATELDCVKMNIGIVEESELLKKWYASYGFVHIGTQKFDFFPFTCGYMEKNL